MSTTALATIDLENALKSSSEIIKNLLPRQLTDVIASLKPEQVKAIAELKPGESVEVTVSRPRTWSELVLGAYNFPVQDRLTIKSPQSITENNQ